MFSSSSIFDSRNSCFLISIFSVSRSFCMASPVVGATSFLPPNIFPKKLIFLNFIFFTHLKIRIYQYLDNFTPIATFLLSFYIKNIFRFDIECVIAIVAISLCTSYLFFVVVSKATSVADINSLHSTIYQYESKILTLCYYG